MRISRKRCPDCFTIFSTEYDLFNHRISECKPNRDISIVKVCTTNTPTATDPAEPTVDEDGPDYLWTRVKFHCCVGCGFKSKSGFNFKRHQSTCKFVTKEMLGSASTASNKEAQTYRCNTCCLEFSRLYNLERHRKSTACQLKRKTIKVTPHKVFRCFDCKKGLITKESLRNHKLRYCPANIPSEPTRLLTCRGCGTNFTKSYNLRRHQAKNCPVLKVLTKDSICYICSTAFPTFDLLKEHLDTNHKAE